MTVFDASLVMLQQLITLVPNVIALYLCFNIVGSLLWK